ncbi:YciI family protein [uncultured Tateyamaria sp.]|uniref:YciI family protein n=1 Tax=uncultured Tateyamaria sp. TaxID=455651 RepID=UPI002622297A|nr:YciI family protein [uncultured Tateyamaria sp.]
MTAYDHPEKDLEREGVRHAHRDYLRSFGTRLIASGALLDQDAKTIIGGASLLDTDDFAEAQRFEAEDPYAKAGIRAHVQITQWRLRWWLGSFNSQGHDLSG